MPPSGWSCALVSGLLLTAGVARADDEHEDDEDEVEVGDDLDGYELDGDYVQPPLTSGGLFTKATYPQSVIDRPLTITGGLTEVLLGFDMGIGAATAFDRLGFVVEARHGFEDNVEGQLRLRSDVKGFGSLEVEPAIEVGLVYDLVDFRAAAQLEVTKDGEADAETRVRFPIGFPFRYAPKPQVALIALDTLMTIDTSGTGKPDLTPSVGIIVQPAPIVAVVVDLKLEIVDFDPADEETETPGVFAPHVTLPASLSVQVSPKNLIDLGLRLELENLKPIDTQPMNDDVDAASPFDARSLLLYGRLRV